MYAPIKTKKRAKQIKQAIEKDYEDLKYLAEKAESKYVQGIIASSLYNIEKILENADIISVGWSESTGSCGWLNAQEEPEFNDNLLKKLYKKKTK